VCVSLCMRIYVLMHARVRELVAWFYEGTHEYDSLSILYVLEQMTLCSVLPVFGFLFIKIVRFIQSIRMSYFDSCIAYYQSTTLSSVLLPLSIHHCIFSLFYLSPCVYYLFIILIITTHQSCDFCFHHIDFLPVYS
jgi:hypothetical protein